jgi:hypothetical protein
VGAVAKDKKTDEDRQPPVQPVTPNDLEFFSWLETLFFGDAQFPERLEVRLITGPKLERLGGIIKQYNWEPAQSRADGPKKPTKEEIVRMSHEIHRRCQQHSDVVGSRMRKVVPIFFGVFAWHMGRSPQPYERWLIRCVPDQMYSRASLSTVSPGDTGGDFGGGGDDDDEEEGGALRPSTQALQHIEALHTLYIEAIGGVMDRMDRIAERQSTELELLRGRYERQQRIAEQALSLEADREERRAWNKVKIGVTERAANAALTSPAFVPGATTSMSHFSRRFEIFGLSFARNSDEGNPSSAFQRPL